MKSTMQTSSLNIAGLLEHGTTVHGESKCITWTENGPRETTYAQIGIEARKLANALRGMGIDADQRVATFMWNNAEHLTAYLAVPAMGAVMHALNIRLFPEQLIYVANHGASEVVVVDNSLAEPFSKLLAHLPKIRRVIVNGPIPDAVREALGAPEHVEEVHDWTELMADQSDEFVWPTSELDEMSASSMCYTSGTTGNPKGVVYSHRSNYVHAVSCAQSLELTSYDRTLVVVPLFHANAWGFPYSAMVAGNTLVMPDRFLQPEPLLRMCGELAVTTGAGVPTIWNGMLQLLDGKGGDVSHLRRLVSGGSSCPPAVMKGFQERHGVEVIQAYGMTETSPLVSAANPPTRLEEGSDEYWRYRLSQGRLIAGARGRIVGPDGEVKPWDGESIGELELSGPWITAAYYSNGTESEAELADMASKFEGEWLRTGDVGTISFDGFIFLSDRAKDVIKSGGEWISSVDLEDLLMAHDDVIEASVVGVPDEKWGERPLAVVVVRDGVSVSMEDLRDHLAAHLARWQVPDRWALIDEVPKTSVGKFDKKRIRAQFADGDLTVSRTQMPAE
ncbi:fatty acid--CoA ligase [Calidifontibacter terrae]